MKQLSIIIILLELLPSVAFAQRGYWFQSNFIQLEIADTSLYFVHIKSPDRGVIDISEDFGPDVQVVSVPSHDGLLIRTPHRPMNRNYYISNVYRSNQVEQIILLPKISLGLKNGKYIDSLSKKYNAILAFDKAVAGSYRFDCLVKTSDDLLDVIEELSAEPDIAWCEPAKLTKLILNNTKYPWVVNGPLKVIESPF